MNRKKSLQGKRKGIFFTLAIVLLMIPLVMLVSFYSSSEKTKSVDTTAKLRCDELHYFVEDVKKDLDRAVVIFGRRAAIYAMDHVIDVPGNPLLNYTFVCNSTCNVDCSRIIYPKNGSEAAIAELTLCGTLNNTNVTYMVDHTVKEWIKKIEAHSEAKNFRINMTLREIKVVPMDAWHFSIMLDSDIDIMDDTGICYYRGFSITSMSNTSIVGLEDPLYTLRGGGNVYKQINVCEPNISITKVIANGTNGNWTGDGKVIFDTEILNASSYCSSHDVSRRILIINGSDKCDNYEKDLCFKLNSSAGTHFAGVVDIGQIIGSGFETETECNVTIPWMRRNNSWPMNLTSGDCILLNNSGSSHQIVKGCGYQSLNYSCYTVSNSSLSQYASGCAQTYPDGPSFFDRLDGSTNLSDRYRNQALTYFGNEFIGIETIIDMYDIVYNTQPYLNASTVDYLYWQNVSGNRMCAVCDNDLALRLDCQHAKRYGVSTGC